MLQKRQSSNRMMPCRIYAQSCAPFIKPTHPDVSTDTTHPLLPAGTHPPLLLPTHTQLPPPPPIRHCTLSKAVTQKQIWLHTFIVVLFQPICVFWPRSYMSPPPCLLAPPPQLHLAVLTSNHKQPQANVTMYTQVRTEADLIRSLKEVQSEEHSHK